MIKGKKVRLPMFFTAGLIGAFIVPSLSPTQTVLAASSEPIKLTYQKTNDTTGTIQVVLNTGTKSVLLPNGTKVTSNTTFRVTQNGTYDFVAYDEKDKPYQKEIVVSNLNVDPSPLTTAHGLFVKLHVDGFDTLSEVDAYRYKLDDSNTWSSWKTMGKTNLEEIQIPIKASDASFIDERKAQVQIRDHAGNVKSTESSFRVDHAYPEIKPINKTIYTNTRDITIPLVTNSYIKAPQKLVVNEDGKSTNINLKGKEKAETLLNKRPNEYKTDWGENIPYTVGATPGVKKLDLTAIKTYNDFKGGTVNLKSSQIQTNVMNVVYDIKAPDGTVFIESEKQADGSYEVPSEKVNITVDFEDDISGVNEVRIFEGEKERKLTPSEISKGKITIPWTLSLGKDGQVSVELVDKAGNSRIIHSNKVTVSNIFVSGFQLTDVVNPLFDFPVKGYTWQFDGNNVRMIPGGQFSFNIYYGLGYVDPNRYIVNGSYQVKIISGGQEVYRSERIPYKQGINQNDPTREPGFLATFDLPRKDINGKFFKSDAEVYITSTLERKEKANGKVLKATFENKDSIGNLIGVLGNNNGVNSIDELIRFNEKN